VDLNLLIPDCRRPLRYLFLDLNSYFASVEQQERPELRGKPVAVAPLYAETTFVIAASADAKKYGVKCGVMVRDARRRCPELTIIPARPAVYVSYHKRILEVADSVLPIEEVCSIDEMRFRLMGDEMIPENAANLANRLKSAICKQVGSCMTASVGIAPNGFLAKVASDMEKPNGLVIVRAEELPFRLHHLKITDFAGLNQKMQVRLNARGIFTSEQLNSASKRELHSAFGSIVGERWWYLLRGFDIQLPKTARKSLGHSNVLSPEFRTEEGCRDMLLRLMHKAAARLRAENLRASVMSVFVQGFSKSWDAKIRIPSTQDSIVMTEHFLRVWPEREFEKPRSVGIAFYDLVDSIEYTPSLFDPLDDRKKMNQAVDQVNAKFGKNSIYLAALNRVKDRAGEKIAFNKTWLFQEGKSDNVWEFPTSPRE
jgi:DNA polymerase-4